MFIPPKYDLFSSIFSCSFLVLSTLHVFPISVFIFLGPCSHGSELVFPSEFSAILPVSIYTPNFLSVFIFSISTVFQSVSPSCGSSPSVSAVSHPTIFFVSVSHSQLFSQLLFSSLHHLQSHCKPDPDFRLSPTALKSSSAIPFFFFFFCPGHYFEFLLHLSLLLSACPATETGIQHLSGPPGFLSFSVHSDHFLVHASWAWYGQLYKHWRGNSVCLDL